MRRSYNFISASVDTQTLKTFPTNDPCCIYFVPLPLDVTNFKKRLPQRKEFPVFGEDRDRNSRATCTFHTTIHETTTQCWHLRAALEGRTNKFYGSSGHNRRTEILVWKRPVSAAMPSTMCECKLGCVDYAVLCCLKTFAKCMQHSCWRLCVHQMHNRQTFFCTVIFTKFVASSGRGEQ